MAEAESMEVVEDAGNTVSSKSLRLLRRFSAIQQRRAESYAKLKRGFDEYMVLRGELAYQQLCGEITMEFNTCSKQIIEMEALFQSPEYGRSDLAQLLRDVQMQEREKLKHVIRSSKILFEDLDTTESECSENDFISDEDWVDPIKHQVGKENANLVSNNRGASRKSVNLASSTTSGLCCSCSSMSTCKTMKCHCRANGGLCGSTCRCIVAKCTNQEKKCELDMSSQI